LKKEKVQILATTYKFFFPGAVSVVAGAEIVIHKTEYESVTLSTCNPVPVQHSNPVRLNSFQSFQREINNRSLTNFGSISAAKI